MTRRHPTNLPRITGESDAWPCRPWEAGSNTTREPVIPFATMESGYWTAVVTEQPIITTMTDHPGLVTRFFSGG